MTKKTLSKILSFGIAVIVVTSVLIVSIFYNYYNNQAEDKLVTVANLAESELERSNNYSFINSTFDNETRITLISADGTVLADSIENTDSLDNHLKREEVEKAINSGESSLIRMSQTINKNMYYYARLLPDGNILRISTESKSIVDILSDVALYIILVVIFVIACSVIISIRITKSIVKPIEELGEHLDNIENIKTFEELMPFVCALSEQKQKRIALDKQKKQFTANMSHELKTPLTSIAGYAELIETGIAKQEDIKPFAGIIRKEALRLVTLSEDIIRLSQMEEEEGQEVSFSSVNLFASAQRCVEALSAAANIRGITLTLEGEECYIRANNMLLEELIYNLCDNAIRYNKENGSVCVKVVPYDTGAAFIVSDTGIGIEDKYKERVFERFFRVDKSRSKQTGGTGLGLAIVKHIVQIHNAELKVNSIFKEGTTISVYFKK